MDRVSDKLIIGLTGMPGCGKDEALLNFKDNIPIFRMGDIVIEEVHKQNLEVNVENVGKVANSLREKYGLSAVAQLLSQKILECDDDFLFVNGIRGYEEAVEFKKIFPNFITISIHTSPKTRFKRISSRQRIDDALNEDAFNKKDLRELSWGLGKIIALADNVVINESTAEKLRQNFEQLVKKILEKNNMPLQQIFF